jgi:hypothetical protein
MLVFMWNMTQSVPEIAIARKITVKMVDSMVQPP